jgi:protein-S-isoprenylcysteine O-methyltransferase Ste14
MIGLLITVIGVIAVIAVVLWYVHSVNLGPPLIYAVYAGIAILAILIIVWIMDRYGGGTIRLSSLAVPNVLAAS